MVGLDQRAASFTGRGMITVLPVSAGGVSAAQPADAAILHTLPLAERFPVVLGLGAFLKNTTALIDGDQAYVTGDAGHTDSVDAILAMEDRVDRLLDRASGTPVAIAHDLHPDFPSTQLALRLAAKWCVPAVPVQHHHAHVAAVGAEHGITGPLLGLAFDGFGLGPAQEAWGGELLFCERGRCRCLGALTRLFQPGGDVAAREPWRMGAAALQAVGRSEEIASRWPERPAAGHLSAMMRQGLNCPPTSSAGRLFDAACGLLDIHPVATFEGQAPMALEALVTAPEVLPGGWRIVDGHLDFRPLLAALVDLSDSGRGADLFHGTLAAGIADWVVRHADCLVSPPAEIAFSGGCFYNRVLSADLASRLGEAGFRVLSPERLGPGDAAISLGQAYVAALSL